MTPPDSDAHEVLTPTARGMCLHTTSGRHQATAVCSACGISLASLVGIDPSLAQRILAALQTTGVAMWRADLLALADELRAVIGK